MHVEVQFSQSKSSSYIQSQEQPIYFFKTRSRGLTSADPWNIIQGSGTDYADAGGVFKKWENMLV